MSKKKSAATRRSESQAASARAAEIRAEQEKKERRRRTAVVSAVGVGVLAIVLVIGYIVQSGRDDTTVVGTAPAGAVGYAVPAGPSSTCCSHRPAHGRPAAGRRSVPTDDMPLPSADRPVAPGRNSR